LGLVVVALSRHVVDALAAGADVALDHARGSLLLQLPIGMASAAIALTLPLIAPNRDSNITLWSKK
jgi:hypothetical protein